MNLDGVQIILQSRFSPQKKGKGLHLSLENNLIDVSYPFGAGAASDLVAPAFAGIFFGAVAASDLAPFHDKQMCTCDLFHRVHKRAYHPCSLQSKRDLYPFPC